MRRILACVLVLAALAGCGRPSVKVALSSAASLNLNEAKESLPVVLRIYQLSEDGPFRNAEFPDLWKKDLATLGDSLLSRDEIVVNPAGQEKLTYSRHERARFVAVMGVFRRPGDKGWRDIKPVRRGFFSRRTAVDVHLKGNTVDIVD